MAKSSSGAVPSDKLELYELLVATIPAVQRKGATMPYTSVNGNMFSYLDKKGTLALRLPTGPREQFLAKYGTALMVAHGVVQAEYVEVPDSLLARTEDLKQYFDASYRYASSLKPKPTRSRQPPP